LAKLVINPTSATKKEIPIVTRVISIGRDPSNDLVLSDSMVSRRHAILEHRDNQYILRDNNSSNGTMVNGDRVDIEKPLRDGDLVAIGSSRLLFQLDERDLRQALAHPHVVIGSDGSALAPYGEMAAGKPHPRSYGTFPRVLGEYVREQRILPLVQAIHKMTGMPAARLGLTDRGLVRTGFAADLVLFGLERLRDRATNRWPHAYPFENYPHEYPEGIDWVLVNGTMAVEEGKATGALAGRVLRHANRN